MTDDYIDASALVQRYADEPGSAWVRQITEPSAAHTIVLAEITLAEVPQHWQPGSARQEASRPSKENGF